MENSISTQELIHFIEKETEGIISISTHYIQTYNFEGIAVGSATIELRVELLAESDYSVINSKKKIVNIQPNQKNLSLLISKLIYKFYRKLVKKETIKPLHIQAAGTIDTIDVTEIRLH